ncbi:MAG: DUF126 domain-containing protein [Chloroflexota bacterium]
MAGLVLQGRMLVEGTAVAPIHLLKAPLSLWGGLDPETGKIIDQRHPNVGEIVTGKVMTLTAGRGSSSASSILLEAVRQKKGPAAIILAEMDGILTLGAAVAKEMYDDAPPVVVLNKADFDLLTHNTMVAIESNGLIRTIDN